MSSFDIIGDVHGHLTKLQCLLRKLGYVESADGFRHPCRQAIFVGDLIDRGPAIRGTLHVVRQMMECGAALVIMGNHEFNALRHAHRPTEYLRRELRQTLEEFGSHPQEWASYLQWFRQLPLFLDVGGLRVVHALWDEDAISTIRSMPAASPDGGFGIANVNDSTFLAAVELILNGFEVPLPGGVVIQESPGSMRTSMRIAWWKSGDTSYRALSLPHDPDLPENPIPKEVAERIRSYGREQPPLFVGHYALPPDLVPWPQQDNVACVDYRAAKRGPLVAYRWDGELKLEPGKFVTSVSP